jgi:uncharacterized protein (TIGR04255 family)
LLRGVRMHKDFPHLSKAPIREAVFDIGVEPCPDVTADAFDAFAEKVQREFPDSKPIRTVQAEFDVGGEAPGVRSKPPQTLGTICWNELKTRAVQARLDGFTVNHVQGYESWDVLRAQAHRLWTDYVAIGRPRKVIRCALRYINRLELPVLVDMSANLLTRPEVAAELPQLVDDFFMRVLVPFPNGMKASITQASEPMAEDDAKVRGLILDINAFSTRMFNVSDDSLWEEFDALRTIKNQCFFSSLKPEMWEAFQ